MLFPNSLISCAGLLVCMSICLRQLKGSQQLYSFIDIAARIQHLYYDLQSNV